MFVPLFKGRERVEYNVLKNIVPYLSDQIVPLVEVLKENYRKEIEYDPITMKPKFEEKNGRQYKVYKPNSPDNENTLEFINELIQGHKVFVDFFRYTITKYGKNINIENVSLSYQLNNNQELYFNKIRSISLFPNMIPVVSIKKEYTISKSLLIELIVELQKENFSIAIRITDDYYDDYKEILIEYLREDDYLLFDIENQNPETKFIELDEIGTGEGIYQKILLCATRDSTLNNGDYPQRGPTDLIYTNTKLEAESNGFDGFGDYCGLKDNLPSNRSGPSGAAIALFYDSLTNQFYSYVEKNTSLGVKGYKNLIPIILEDKLILNVSGNCPVVEMIEKDYTEGKNGNWCTWLFYCVIRYIDQVYKNSI